MDLIHHGRLKFIIIIWWWPNLVVVVGWQPNLVTMQLWNKNFLVITHMWWWKTFWSPPHVATTPFDRHNVFPLPPTLCSFLSSLSPFNGDWNLFNCHVVWSLHKKMGVLMGTHWEFEGNMLGIINGKMENNPSLLGIKFDTIL